jgi:nitrogen fixation NifU-like protein
VQQSGDLPTSLYREAIRRHAADPTGYRLPLAATHSHEIYNALCGDRIEVRLRLDGEAVRGAAFDGEACAICLASASLLCGLAPGRTAAGVRRLAARLAEALGAHPVGADSSANVLAKSQHGGYSHPGSRINPLPQPGDSERRADFPDSCDTDLPEELHPLLGVRPYPSRVRCATLPWEAAVAALKNGD